MGGLQTPSHVDNRPTIYQQIESLKAEIADLKRCLKASNTEIDKLREDSKAQNQAIVNFVRMCSAPAVPAASVPEMPKGEPKTYTPSQIRQALIDEKIPVYPGEIQSFLIRNGWAKLNGTNIMYTPKGEKEGIITLRMKGRRYVNITEKGYAVIREHFAEVNR